MSKLKEFIVKKYISGKSLQYFIDYLSKEGLESNDVVNYIADVHHEYWKKRSQRALLDVIIGSISILLCIFKNVEFIFLGKPFQPSIFYLISFVIWIPFYKSAYTVYSSKKEFDSYIKI